MTVRLAITGAALAAGLTVAIPGADNTAAAATLTGSFAAWQAGVGSGFTTTPTTGLFDPLALDLPSTSSIPLNGGTTVTLSMPGQVTQPQDGFPYLLSSGFAGDLLIPQGTGAPASGETLSLPSGLDAFGFEAVPFSSGVGGPYVLTVQLSSGEVLSETVPGGDFDTGTTAPVFFGYYGGPVSSLTLTSTDPNGLAFGDFVSVADSISGVPEPASLAVLAMGVAAVSLARRLPR